ncbi:hypothetical protein Q1695_014626 [Nippostrongylus brasiliensis]|nr:hypothetical protein Q1695_014626 [Nippostrongylus brasiliensis]
MITEATVDLMQHINTPIATACALFVHGFIIYRIRSNYSVLSQYQNLLIVQSSIYLVATTMRLVVNRNITLAGVEERGYPFLPLSRPVEFALVFFLDMIEPAESAVLAIFNVHRVLLFMRPTSLKLFYAIVIPLSLTYMEAVRYYSFAFFVSISAIIFACYLILRQHFKTKAYSARVKRLHSKLSYGIIAQALVHVGVILLVGLQNPVALLCTWIWRGNEADMDYASALYGVAVYLIFIWYPFVIGLLIRWSISGFLNAPRASELPSLIADTAPTRRTTIERGMRTLSPTGPRIATVTPSILPVTSKDGKRLDDTRGIGYRGLHEPELASGSR